MTISWITTEEDRLLRALIASMKTHAEEEWDALWHQIKTQRDVMNEWGSRPQTSLEYKFDTFWNLVCIYAESIADEMPCLSKLEWGQKKRELQLGCLKGLHKYDAQGRSTVLGWLRVAWRFWDSNVSRRKRQQAEMARPEIIGKDGKMMPLLDSLRGSDGDPLGETELKEMAEIAQSYFAQRAPSSPWRIAVAVWLDDTSYIEDPEEYPTYTPRARKNLVRELACGPLPKRSFYESTMHRDVLFRRRLWKKLSAMLIDRSITPGNWLSY
jgi:hypothetical protein